jgi:hypothetical protein
MGEPMREKNAGSTGFLLTSKTGGLYGLLISNSKADTFCG